MICFSALQVLIRFVHWDLGVNLHVKGLKGFYFTKLWQEYSELDGANFMISHSLYIPTFSNLNIRKNQEIPTKLGGFLLKMSIRKCELILDTEKFTCHDLAFINTTLLKYWKEEFDSFLKNSYFYPFCPILGHVFKITFHDLLINTTL